MDSKEDSPEHLRCKGKEKERALPPGAIWDELLRLCGGETLACMC